MYGCFNKDPSFSHDWQTLVCSAISKIIRKSPKNPMVQRKMGVMQPFSRKRAPHFLHASASLYFNLTLNLMHISLILPFTSFKFVFLWLKICPSSLCLLSSISHRSIFLIFIHKNWSSYSQRSLFRFRMSQPQFQIWSILST